jgi:hypothetical protein
MSGHDEPEGYDGEVTLVLDGEPPRTVHAALAAHFDPVAGHVVWTGRVCAEIPPRTAFALTTPFGTACAVAVERDVWGNTRLSGVDRPPFRVPLLDDPEGRLG